LHVCIFVPVPDFVGLLNNFFFFYLPYENAFSLGVIL